MSVQPLRRRTLTDGELVRLACAGHRRAFDELIDRYQRRAVSVSYRLLGNIHDALEVCQEAFVRAYRKLRKLDDPERFGPWLLRIVTNLSLNRRRVRNQRPPMEECNDDDDLANVDEAKERALAGAQPSARLSAHELAADIQAGLSELPQRQRDALVLFSINQLPQRLVAEILGCSVEAVKWHVFQARKKLKLRLADYL